MTLLALFASLALHATESQILHLSLRCADRPPTHDAGVIARQLRRHNPGATIREVAMSWPCGAGVDVQDAAADELRRMLGAALDGRSDLDLLALDLPDGDERHSTLMMPLGHLGADGLTVRMAEILAPLKDRAARDAKIVLTAGHGLGESIEVAEARVRHLLAFVGAPAGSVFGLNQPKTLFERPSRKDFNLGQLMLAVAIGFDQMVWRQPSFTFGPIVLSGLYSAGFRMLHNFVSSTVFGAKPPAVGDAITNGHRFNMMMASILGTVVAAAQVMTFSDLAPGTAQSFAWVTVATVPPIVLIHMIRRRWPWITGYLRESINGGRMFKARGDGTFDVRRGNLEDHAGAIFACESALTEPAPMGEPAAA